MPKARTHSDRATRRTLGVGLMIAGLTACGDSPTLIEAELLPHRDVHPISGCPDLIHDRCCNPYPALPCSCSPIDLSGGQLKSDVYFGEMTFWHDNRFCYEGPDGAHEAAQNGLAYFLDDPGDCWWMGGGHLQDEDGERSEMFVNTDNQSYLEQIQTIFHEGLSMARCHGIMGLAAQTACHQGVHDDIESENMEEVCYDGHPWEV
jgi:hypothetical protein